jgi:general secretion pathway protein L
LRPFGDLAMRAWSWWSAELRGMVPAWLARRIDAGRPGGTWLIVGPEHAAIGSIEQGQLRAHTLAPRPAGPPRTRLARQAATVAIGLDASLVFETTVEFPIAAEASLRAILNHHVGLIVPLDPADAVFDHVVLGRDQASQTIRVALAVTRRGTLNRACDIARQHGLTPDRAIVTRSGTVDERFDFLRRSPRLAQPQQRRVLLRRLEAAAALLLVAAIGMHLYRSHAERQQLARTIELLRQPAEGTRELRQRIDQLAEPLAFLGDRLAAAPRLAILDALTRLLPDDTWLTALRLHGRDIELTGSSPHAASLIGLIAGAPGGFETPQFRAPITTGPDGRERFDLAVAVTSRGSQ